MAILRRSFVALLAGLVMCGCGGQNVRGPFRNQYVDAETGEPIPSVVFLAVWHTVTLNPVSGGSENFYEAREAVSGPDGKVDIPALGWWRWRLTLNVRFYEFIPNYINERVEIGQPSQRAYVGSTRTLMRMLRTNEELCEATYRPALLPLIPTRQMPRYAQAIHAQRQVLRCGR